MLWQEVRWLRAHSEKICPQLRNAALQWYRPVEKLPCFFHKPSKFLKQRFKKIPIIVQFDENALLNFSVQDLSKLNSCTLKNNLSVINAFSTKVNAQALEKLSQQRSIKRIWLDREVKAVLDVASSTVKAAPLWDNNVTGKGVTVAIIDTGIYQHPDLSGRIIAFKDLVKNKTSPYDDNGHGTHVAGDVAANGSQSAGQYRGPASEANLVGIKVLDKTGSGQLSTVIEGIQWCIDNKDSLNIKVINMSLGSQATESYAKDPICQAVEKAWQAGIVVCAAAGNDGPEASTINSPGIDPVIITVGALNDNNTLARDDDQVADFSSRGPTIDNYSKPDVLAPGVDIISLRSPNSTLDKTDRSSRIGEWYTSLSGTSMATPICCGVVAQIIQSDPALTPDQIKSRLLKSSIKLSNADSNAQGAGVIDAGGAISIKP